MEYAEKYSAHCVRTKTGRSFDLLCLKLVSLRSLMLTTAIGKIAVSHEATPLSGLLGF